MLDKLTEMTTQDLKRIRDFINVELQYRNLENVTELNTGYVKDKQKDNLLKEIISNFTQKNPNKDRVGFQEVLSTLKDSYGIETRSIGNFFLRQLKDYETFGGNKKKYIKINC
jgi:hypothetical protein|tara:strand:+ start:219 stop:557 length:339 start_codon:yes stop_codon:yes gene_type:complete